MENIEENITSNKQCAVVCVNLDDFRRINDDFGMFVGDELIITYATRIEKIVGNDDFVGKISGAEDVLRCAEKAMFISKNNGKNKICLFSPVDNN